MPSSKMEHEDQWKLPKDVPLKARLDKVEVKTIKWTKDGVAKERDLWKWEFKILSGEYAGLRAWGETEDKMTNHPDNKVRQWGEALTGQEYALGDGIDTDDLLALECVVILDNTSRPKKGETGNWYDSPVIDVLPISALDDLQDSEPPF